MCTYGFLSFSLVPGFVYDERFSMYVGFKLGWNHRLHHVTHPQAWVNVAFCELEGN